MSGLALTVVGIHSALLVTGLSGNIFMLVVHFLDWLKTRVPNPCNIIINSIGTSNILLQGAVAFQEICFAVFPDFFGEVLVSILLTGIMTSLALSSLWCATCLCFYYCIKIVNFNSPFMYRLKAKLPIVVPWLIVFSTIMTWSSGMSAYWDLYYDISLIQVNITGNITLFPTANHGSRCRCYFEMSMFIASLAFAIIILTGGAIITSLCRHMSRIKQNNEGSNSRIHTHLSAAKTVASLLILYLVMYITFTVLSDPEIPKDETIPTIGFIMVASFPTINSYILILGNRKLINVLKKIFGIKIGMNTTESSVPTHD